MPYIPDSDRLRSLREEMTRTQNELTCVLDEWEFSNEYAWMKLELMQLSNEIAKAYVVLNQLIPIADELEVESATGVEEMNDEELKAEFRRLVSLPGGREKFTELYKKIVEDEMR